MLNALDIPTLLTVLWLLLVLMTVVFGAMWLKTRSDEVAGTLALGFLSMTCGSLIASQYPVLPQWTWAILACALVLLGEALLWAGVRAFDGRRTTVTAVLAIPAAYVAICLATGLWVYQPWRAALFSLLLAVLSLGCAYQLHVGGRTEPLSARRPLAVLFAALGIVYAGRGAAALAGLGTYSLVALVSLVQVFNAFAFALGLFALIKERAERALRHAADTDQLTQIANRRSFFRLAQSPVGGAMLLIDLDHFKRVNDRFGHAVGDEVLVRFAALVSTRLRPGEVFARLGGEEFALFLPNCRESEAMACAERLRRTVTRLEIAVDGVAVAVTVSIGVAASDAPISLEALLGEADAALYRAKELGRNRVHSASLDAAAAPAAPARAA